MLAEHGVQAANVHLLNKFILLIKAIEYNRADVFAYEENVAKHLMQKNLIPPGTFVPIYTLSEGELYYTFNASVDDRVVEVFQRALDVIKKNEAFIEGITNKYLK
ncbi:type 2 periplasmic-binding domain-containing protein [Piscirickettsia litoralis]|uniref:Solute-binding protein family 3/N-terminal domain-containing protein n=1 Tax=Piscirickettsia litoralis TaxID=1891921 RepID=A0ABX3A502_9GAMM|nr:hypothetical protein [Piscirickettsia litoralis]ODN43312.1 hypothetical protein BGC07_10740 [Piscirickettsia litoralis]